MHSSAMKVIFFLLLGLTSSVMTADADKRVRRNLFVDWLWDTNNADPTESAEEHVNLQIDEAERDINRTPKARCSVAGVWYNHLGSQVIINASRDGILLGEYRTAVEREHGSAGQGPARLIGHISTGGNQQTFGMTVVWSNGQSVTSWTGQCLLCEGKETLMTTWILTSKMDSCNEFWMANRIGQDMFTRTEVKDGPRREDDTHNPRDFARHLKQEEIDDQLDL